MNQYAPALILGSSSPYRRELLQRLTTGFQTESPDIDETPLTGEAPADLAIRLAAAKAAVVAAKHPDSLVIASDQVASLDGRPLGKPGNRANAIRQLTDCSGQTVVFYTAVEVIRASDGFRDAWVDETRVQFRDLTAVEIGAYVDRDEPFNCAGSFRSEGLGAALFTRIENQDPTALIGLPLIRLAASLTAAGLSPLSQQKA